MAIHTSSNTYRRGISNDYKNFFFVTQTNNVVLSPMSSYLHGYKFYSRNYLPQSNYRWSWRP